MTSLLSALSGHFTKALIFGTLVPVAVFVLLAGVTLEPLLPDTLPIMRAFHGLDLEWKAAWVFLIVAILTGLLYNLNIPLTRLYEGYPWKDSWIGGLRIRRHKAVFQQLDVRWSGYRTLRYALEGTMTTDAQKKELSEIVTALSDTGRELQARFPRAGGILPTRLGNVIRAFETYPLRQYQMSAIPLWPRLVAVVDPTYASLIEDQKASFDFMLHSSALAALLAALTVLLGLLFPVPFAHPAWLVLWLAQAAMFAVVAVLCYLASIGRALAWGATVKGAFDLYRRPLLAKLGFTQTPANLAAERELWGLISEQMIFGDTRRVPLAEYTAASTKAVADPSWLSIAVARSVEVTSTANVFKVHLTVTNDDTSKRAAKSVTVRASLAENWELVYASASRTDGGALTVTGTNPIVFTVSTSLAHGASVEIVYSVIHHKD